MGWMYLFTRDLPTGGLHPTELHEFLDKVEQVAQRRGTAVDDICVTGDLHWFLKRHDGVQISGVVQESVVRPTLDYAAHLEDGKQLTWSQCLGYWPASYRREKGSFERLVKDFVEDTGHQVRERGHAVSFQKIRTVVRYPEPLLVEF